jgi:hypothetical protein
LYLNRRVKRKVCSIICHYHICRSTCEFSAYICFICHILPFLKEHPRYNKHLTMPHTLFSHQNSETKYSSSFKNGGAKQIVNLKKILTKCTGDSASDISLLGYTLSSVIITMWITFFFVPTHTCHKTQERFAHNSITHTHVKISQLVNKIVFATGLYKLAIKLQQCCYFIKLLQGCHLCSMGKLFVRRSKISWFKNPLFSWFN